MNKHTTPDETPAAPSRPPGDYAQDVCSKAHEVYDKAHEAYDRAHDKMQAYCADVQSYAAQMKGKTGLRRIINALGYSWDGIRAACDEAGFRQLLWINGILILLALLLPFTLAVQLVLILASALSLVVELINTGIEAAVDHTSLAQHELAKRAKDVGSAAQYLLLAVLLLMWLLALWRTFAAT
ncbi:diacylglycerol kinase [Neisseria shayeganii 871]|uniref:Diacylglycerol kinase n=2 Tax=Neisseria shayeganii TaxID=607712 RepID=G4CK31_9NEIS|nr:diacylglycerol kinase [Neisseria shayeganii 871]